MFGAAGGTIRWRSEESVGEYAQNEERGIGSKWPIRDGIFGREMSREERDLLATTTMKINDLN
jgi:hypothetical protein